jgi:hypothetical protein
VPGAPQGLEQQARGSGLEAQIAGEIGVRDGPPGEAREDADALRDGQRAGGRMP